MIKWGLFFIGLILLNACDRQTKTQDPHQLKRMTETRQRIKQELGKNYNLPVPPATKQQLERGAELYARLCATCHGPRGKGKGKLANDLVGSPTDFTDEKQATFFSEQARLYIIRQGIEGTPMLGWGNILTEGDLLAVYLYVRSLIDSK